MEGPIRTADIAREHLEPLDTMGALEERILKLASQEQTPYVPWDGNPPVHSRAYWELEDGYYGVTVDQRGESGEYTLNEYTARTDDAVREAASPAETIAFSELPSLDRVRILLSPLGYHLRSSGRTEELETSVTFVYPLEDAREASVFVPDPQYRYLRTPENTFELELTDQRPRQVDPHQVTASLVAETKSELGEHILAEDTGLEDPILAKRGARVQKAALSTEARELVREARQEGEVNVCDPMPDHFTEVLNVFNISVGQPEDEERYVEYDGEWYHAHLR